MKQYSINSYEEAVSFANNLVKFAASKKFKPISIKTDWGNVRSLRQSKWYFRTIGKLILPHLEKNPQYLSMLIKRALGVKLDIYFIHSCLKLIYLNGMSTTKISTEKAAVLMKEIRHDFLHDYGGLYIPEPPEKTVNKDIT